VRKLELREEQKAYVKIVNLLLAYLLTFHIVACIAFLIYTVEMIWVPPLDFIYVQRKGYFRFNDMEEVTEWY
jgi:hypothetical protein